MSFVRAKKAQAIKAEDLKGPETVSTGSLATTLTETNKILVEIQNQLAIDFANRIAEKKQTLKLSRKTGRKKKLGEKEEFVERGTKLQKSANAFGKKVLAPIKSIFDKLLDFLTIVGGGILLNAAWVWLQDEENREKLVKIFTFLKTYWKEILVGLLTLKVVSAIGKLVGFALTLRKLFKKLRGLGRRPPGAGGTRGINPPPGGGGCGPVTGKGGCLDQLSATSQVAGNLAKTLFATAFAVNYFKRFMPKAAPAKQEPAVELPGEKETPREAEKGKPFDAAKALKVMEDLYGVSPAPYLVDNSLDLGRYGKAGAPSVGSSINIPGYDPKNRDVYAKKIGDYISANPNSELARVLVNGAVINGNGEENGRIFLSRDGIEFLDAIEKNAFYYAAQALGLTQSVFDAFPTGISRGARGSGVTRRPITKIRPSLLQPQRTNTRSNTGKLKLPRGIDIKTLSPDVRIYLEGQSKTTQDALIEQIRQDIKLRTNVDLLKESKEKIQTRSMGGTIFGKGSQTVDSVPAMLAPGEEVIRSSASNIFRPVLKDINDNAGRMFIAFRDATNRMTKNNVLQADETSRSLTLFEKFKDLLDDQIQKIELEKFKEAAKETLLVNGPTNNNNTGRTMLLSNTQQQSNATQNLLNQPQTEPQTPTLKVSLNAPTVDLNQYNHTRNRRTDSGEGSIQTLSMNLPGTVVDARTPTQAQPEEQPTDSSSTDIIIAPMDGNNPFFSRSLSAYGVDFT